MKIKQLLLMSLIACAFFACDKVDGPYRDTIVAGDFCTTGIDDSIPNKKVLVEDYTGHACGNCPPAGVFLNDTLKATYNHCLVVISVHAGFFAGTCPSSLVCMGLPANHPAGSFMTDYNSAIGTAWNTFFHVAANPKGMIDRIDYPTSTQVKTYNAWASAVASELAKDAKAKISITNAYNPTTRNVDVVVKSDFVAATQGNFKLQVVITEDSLADWQLWYGHAPTEYVPDYIHRHVLRDGLNSTWGDVLGSNPNTGQSFTKAYSYTINNAWVDSHCNIVAFIYDADTYEILQVEEASVK